MLSIRFTNILLFIGTILLILSKAFSQEIDPDIWGYLDFGRRFNSEVQFPLFDTFSYLPTREIWIYHEWLFGVVLEKALTLYGESAIQVGYYSVIILSALFLVLIGKQNKNNLTAVIAVLVLASPLFFISYSPFRAQCITNLFTIILFWLYFKSTDKNNCRLILLFGIVLELLWVNLHGGFLLGICFLALFCAVEYKNRQAQKTLFLLFISFILASFLNPYGADIWKSLYWELGVARPDVSEWWNLKKAISLNEYSSSSYYFIFLGAVTALTVLLSKRRFSKESFFLILMFIPGVLVLRHQAFFYIAVAIFIPRFLSESIERFPAVRETFEKSFLIRTIVPIVFVLFASWQLFNSQASVLKFKTGESPSEEVEWISHNYKKANILTELEWGSYLGWKLPDSFKIAIDGRYTTVFAPQIISEYFSFLNANKVNEFLGRYNHEIILLKKDSGVILLLKYFPEWKIVYQNNKSIIFSKIK